MFDPSEQLHDYYIQKGFSDLEAHKLANLVSGRCPVGWRAHNKPDRTSVNSAETQHMTEYANPDEVPVGQDSEIIDLGFDVTEADVARPVLRSGNYDATIAFVRRENSRNKNLPTLVVGYKLLKPTVDVNGKEVNKGFTLVQRILMQPTGGLTEEMIKRRIQQIHFAAAGPGKVTTGAWLEKPVTIRVNVREAHKDEQTGEEYDASNDVSRVLPPPKTAVAEA